MPGRRLCPCGGAPTVPGAGVPPARVPPARVPPAGALPAAVTSPRPGPSPPRRTDQHGPPKMAAPEVKLGVGWPREGERDEGGAAAPGVGGSGAQA